MVSSLDKLTNKLKTGNLNEQDHAQEKADMYYLNKDAYPSQKKFVEENSKEILIVARDGCYTYQTFGES